MDTAELHRRSVATWLERLAAVGDDDWDRPTPCTEWSVRDLVNHVVGEDRWTAPLMQGRTIAEVGDSLDGDLLGAEPGTAAVAAGDEAVREVSDRLTDDLTVQLSYGEEAADEYVRQLIADHVIHAWDLAAAVGADRELEPALVAELTAWFADREDGYRQVGAIGPAVALDDKAGAQARLLAAFGRDPEWTAG
jgi:uncharacterized protein (TIGR03086 family)